VEKTGEGGTSATVAVTPQPPAQRDERDERDERDVLAAVGGRLAQYELIRPLGRGGMGAVYLARDTRLGRLVAIKVVRGRELLSAERFRVEARATARCVHENIVVIHDIGEHAGHLYMALEYLSGVTLKQWLETRRAQPQAEAAALPVERAIQLILPVVRAMVCAHEHGIVHRDLKPSNIMLTDAGVIKVLDFGVAKLFGVADPPSPAGASVSEDVSGSSELTDTGLLVGSGYYMSPEQRGTDEVDHRSDIWAVGVTLFELVAGRHPLRGKVWTSLTEVANLDVPMPRLADARPDAGKLASIVDRCLLKRKTDRIGSARELLGELEALLPAGAGRRSAHEGDEPGPYAGLAAFQENDADRFFGRTRDIAYAAVLLREQPLVAVVGPSGAGKSSFVRAGVVPALKHSGDAWEALVVRPGRHPLAALAGLLLGDDSSSGTSRTDADRDALYARLGAEPGYLGVRLRARSRRKLCRTLLLVDQFEELYTLGADAAERHAFANCLEAVADDASSPLRVVLTIRSDFLDRVTEDSQLMNALVGGMLLLPPLAREALEESLVRPLQQVGYRFETRAMVSDMLDALESTRGALPLLQFTAARLWEMRDRAREVLTEASYRVIGGVAGTLASHADAVLASMSTREQALARTFFERLVTPERTRAPAALDELRELATDREQAERVLTRLVEARLLVVETDAERQGSTASIVHESLIERWPTLAQWLTEHEEDAAFLARLRSAAREWSHSGRPGGLLWRDEAMLEARRWRRRSAAQVASNEAAFLAAVFALAERSARRRRLAIIGLGVALVAVAAALGSLAWRERRASRHARDEAGLAHVAADHAAHEASRARDGARLAAARDLERDPTLALALLREVEDPAHHRAWPTLAAQVLRAPVAQAVLEGMDGIVWTAEYSPDGKHVATAAADTAYVWNADGTGAPLRLSGHTGPIWQASYSRDGKHLLTSSWDGTVRVWNPDGQGEPVVLRQQDRISWAEFSPDGSHVVTGGWDANVWVWRTDGAEPPVILRGHKNRVRRVAFSPDGKKVASASFDGTARVWNADGSGAPVVLAGHTGIVWTVAFSPDGRRVATGAKDGTARLWNADGSGRARVLPVGRPGVSSLVFSHDGKHLATTSWDARARVWDVDDASAPPVVLVGHTGDVNHAAFSPDDRHLVTCSADKTARIWNVDGSGAPVVLSGFEQGVLWVAFSPDGEHIVTAAGDASARIWSARDPNAPVVLAGDPDDEARGAVFAPDGRRVLVHPDANGSAHLWNVDGTGAALALATRCERVLHADFSPGGERVATVCEDGRLVVSLAASGATLLTLRDPRVSKLLWVEYSQDGQHLLASGEGGALVWRADGAGTPTLLRPHTNVQFARFDPDNLHVLLVSSEDNTPEIWRADGQGTPLVLRGHTNNIHWAAFSPDGRLAVTAAGDNTARVWHVDGSAPSVVLAGHTHEVRRASFSSDSRRVLTVSDDATARVWNADGTGTPLVLRGHDDGVQRGSFSPDGGRVVTASERTLRVWRSDGEGVPIVLEGVSAGIQDAGFSPDGRRVWAASKDGRTWIWPRVEDIPTVRSLQQALWRETSYCMPAERRRELVGVSEETAAAGLAECRASVAAAR